MHPRIAALLDLLDTTSAGLLTEVRDIPPDTATRRPAPDRWSVAETVDHLAVVHGRVVERLGDALQLAKSGGLAAEANASPIDTTGALARWRNRERRFQTSAAGAPRDGCTLAAALSAFEDSQTRFRALLVSADGLALGEISVPHAVLGPMSMYDWAVFVAGHESRHLDQIRETLAQLA